MLQIPSKIRNNYLRQESPIFNSINKNKIHLVEMKAIEQYAPLITGSKSLYATFCLKPKILREEYENALLNPFDLTSL